jgi:hypothetical protein
VVVSIPLRVRRPGGARAGVLQYGATPEYLTLWLPLLGIPIGLLVGGWILKAKGKRGLGSIVLGLLAIPPFLFIAFYGLLLATNPSWH